MQPKIKLIAVWSSDQNIKIRFIVWDIKERCLQGVLYSLADFWKKKFLNFGKIQGKSENKCRTGKMKEAIKNWPAEFQPLCKIDHRVCSDGHFPFSSHFVIFDGSDNFLDATLRKIQDALDQGSHLYILKLKCHISRNNWTIFESKSTNMKALDRCSNLLNLFLKLIFI